VTLHVRKAVPSDFERFRPLMDEWIAEMNPDGLKFDPIPEKLIETFVTMASNPASTTLVLLKDDELIGVLGLIRHGWGMCKTANYASEYLWYVKKKSPGAASALVDAAKKWAAENGCDYLIFAINRLSTERADKGNEFLTAAGFRPLYRLYLTEVGHV